VLIDKIRLLKLIVGIGSLLLALIPGLLVLGEMTFFFNWLFALCTLALIGIGSLLIAKRKTPFSSAAGASTALTIFMLVGFVVIIVIPNFVAATLSRQANPCVNNLRQIDAAKNQWALENGKTNGDVATENDIKPYIKLDVNGNLPKCPLGGTYQIGRVGEDPECSIGTSAWPNDHVLNETNYFWTNVKMAYSVLFGLRQMQRP